VPTEFDTLTYVLLFSSHCSYMSWVTEGTRVKGGLYRMDLAEVSNGERHETRPKLILDQLHLGAFTVDPANFRLLVADKGNNTVVAVRWVS
jgi:proto-oncogene tyrosine-protein kinase ROS